MIRITWTFFKVERVSQIAWAFLLALTASTLVSAQSNSPALFYASAKAGPNHGWANSSTKGAAITVWGRNFGTTRGTSYVTVDGVNLTNASDYGEWGATTNPTTAKGFQRITFWLNSSMATGATTVSVTVGGVTSNTLPFTIDNTAYQGIRFVDTVNGSESYDGQYPDHTLGGSHGPWLYVSPGNTWTNHPGVVAGSFIYMRGGTYTNICPGGSYHCPRSAPFGNADSSGPPLVWYSGPFDGTDALRITVTEYPGEHAHFLDASIYVPSSYWTFTNFTIDGDLAYQGIGDGNVYMAIESGNPVYYCTGVTYVNHGNQIIGMSFIGNLHIPFQIWGIGTNILANYISNIPTTAGLGIQDSYNFYIPSTTDTVVKDNEMHRGAHFKGQMYDESRCNGGADSGRGIANMTFDSNWLDMNQSDVSPQVIGEGIILGMGSMGSSDPNPFLTNITISNNVIYRTDTGTIYDAIGIDNQGSPVTINGLYIYNNTIYNTNNGFAVNWSAAYTSSNVYLKNNIFSNLAGYHSYNSSSQITPLWSYNLTDKVLSTTGPFTNQGNNVNANPGFVSTSTPDFHLSSAGSPANGAGITLSGITLDYDGLTRPNPPAIGAYEYAAGSAPAPPTQLTATVH
ncbi:MAG: hypothetical protein WCC22_13340 [Terriglobales bacterium]